MTTEIGNSLVKQGNEMIEKAETILDASHEIFANLHKYVSSKDPIAEYIILCATVAEFYAKSLMRDGWHAQKTGKAFLEDSEKNIK
jgi:hypothetical protein